MGESDEIKLENSRRWHRERYYKFQETILGNKKIKYQHNKRKAKNQTLLQKFGLSLETYEFKCKVQGNVCALCGKPETKVYKKDTNQVKRLAVDHCHTKGTIRGLLCQDCNVGLGCFKDRADILEKAANYIRFWEVDEIF